MVWVHAQLIGRLIGTVTDSFPFDITALVTTITEDDFGPRTAICTVTDADIPGAIDTLSIRHCLRDYCHERRFGVIAPPPVRLSVHYQ